MNGFPIPTSTPISRRRRLAALGCAFVVLATTLLPAAAARAQCSCPTGGIPLLDSVETRGNDLNELRGHCAPRNATIEVQAYQRHLQRRELCPPRCPAREMWGFCIDQCEWTTIAQTTADG
ncbi:hypothetical protein KGQ64_16960, partial [bacterium]|nr:hypothetical protein [bacterium]